MADNKKYYYLKLKENFFDSDTLVILESQKDGYLYSNILLKMYLKSLKNDGRLAFNNLIPYNIEMLATLTRHQVGTVERALKMFETLGLIEVLDNGVIYMADIQNFIGTGSSEAERKREYRKRINEERTKLIENVGQCPDKRPPEIEKELEKELELEKDILLSTNVDTSAHFDYQSVANLFNSICVSLPKVQKLTDIRKKRIKKASKELNNDFKTFFEKVEHSDFLSGRNGKWNRCSFDWILNPQNFIKIIEGNYDEEKVANNPNEQNRLGDKSNNTSYDIDKFNKLDMLDMMAALKK